VQSALKLNFEKMLVEQNQEVERNYVEVIAGMYCKLKARVKTDKTGNIFKIKKGVKQSDLLSFLLFNYTLEVFREMEWRSKGIIINGEYLSYLRYADDVVLMANLGCELSGMTQELNEKGKKRGLEELR
jgi:hypothetical protein